MTRSCFQLFWIDIYNVIVMYVRVTSCVVCDIECTVTMLSGAATKKSHDHTEKIQDEEETGSCRRRVMLTLGEANRHSDGHDTVVRKGKSRTCCWLYFFFLFRTAQLSRKK